ncbi:MULTISPECIES: VRR-NUC domain-containing protein [Burkholderiaceae]|uniref:VRR-NUC domain-containing protein n=1 Tax=Burkholderiaceae TaxID=119060 RepID=UPI000966DBE3|nr:MULTISPECIES: VRR-NUC domain-containing protein [Burkholderiaceae]MCG1018327.1 VRR-NUC domain-containing protein [Mycetohabitans sp. B4]SIT66566.1 VRR-NUC domain-containing protein [Burkholderia sp. b13]
MDAILAGGVDPFYYVANFRRAIAWLSDRCDDLLDGQERAFIDAFESLPHASRALLVRMLMRKGPLFRTDKLRYAEIGEPLAACEPLITRGWVELDPPMSIDELFTVATKAQLERRFVAAKAARGTKAALLDALRAAYPGVQHAYSVWCPDEPAKVVHFLLGPLCDRLRLMFFGNLWQDWSEFVLADLGVFRYEAVRLDGSSRAFQQREDVDAYFSLHACRQALNAAPDDATLDTLLAQARACPTGNLWLDMRRAKVLFRIGQHCERRRDWPRALHAYEASTYPDARYRRVRVLETLGRRDDALALAAQVVRTPVSEGEAQRAARTLARLQRVPRAARQQSPLTVQSACGERLSGRNRTPSSQSDLSASAMPISRSDWLLPMPTAPMRVEHVLRAHLHRPEAPVFYVENALINTLFGLLCWQVIFAPIPGAFFHPFQRGPADLDTPMFVARRQALFDACLQQLDDGRYRRTIEDNFAAKAGIQSPFVAWGVLDPALLTLALDCMPAAHLKLWFERLLRDISRNRSGLPDLIRFVPAVRSYELIEVKGPGDRLQDNQVRWLAYAHEKGLPVSVAHVRWLAGGGSRPAPPAAVNHAIPDSVSAPAQWTV